MTTGLLPPLRRAALALALATAATPASAQPIEAGSQDALELPGAREYAPPRSPAAARTARERATLGAISPDLPATLPPQRRPGIAPPYGGYAGYGENGFAGDDRSGYAGRDGYGDGGGYGGGSYGDRAGYGDERGGEFGNSGRADVAPFGGGPGNQTPIPFGAGSLYSGSAVNGTAAGPQYSSQLPAPQTRPRR